MLKGFDADKINTITSAVIELLQGQGGPLANVLADTGAFSAALGARDQLIGEVITNLNAVLATVDAKSAQFSASVDQLQQLVSGLAKNRDPIAGAISPLASTTTDLTELLRNSRRPLQGILENARPLATELDNRKAEVNNDIEQLGEDYLRLSALGSYGAFFNIYFCSVTIKINGPAGSDILLPIGGQPDPSKGGAPLLNRKPSSKHERDPLRTGIFGLVLVICVVLIAFGYSGLPFWPQGKTYDAYFTDAGGITPVTRFMSRASRWARCRP